jgi:hypothetical protein
MNNPFLIEIEDKTDYTLEDYDNIQKQLNDKRIDNILLEYYSSKIKYCFDEYKNNCVSGITQQLIETELPTKKLYEFGNYENCNNCFVCYIPNQQDKIHEKIIKSLKDEGYNGHFYLLNGGFPNPRGIETKYAGVPKCFKIFMMLEAQKIGFDKVIWIDPECYCINNLIMLKNILNYLLINLINY